MATVATRRIKVSTRARASHAAGNGIGEPALYLAFELDDEAWKLGFTTGLAQRPRERRVRPRDKEAIGREIAEAKRRFGLPASSRVISCYEAGREGFWLHRFFLAHGVENRIVDSSSIETNRPARRAKADRLDLDKLLRMLIRHEAGEKTWCACRSGNTTRNTPSASASYGATAKTGLLDRLAHASFPLHHRCISPGPTTNQASYTNSVKPATFHAAGFTFFASGPTYTAPPAACAVTL